MTVDGIKYERRDGQDWEMLLFEREEISSYLSRMVEVKRSIYEVVEFESDVERRFATGLDAREDIPLLFAIVKEEDGHSFRSEKPKEVTPTTISAGANAGRSSAERLISQLLELPTR